jgi:putative transposase
MTRLRRMYFNRAVYHVCIRGNNKAEILADDDDKLMFLRILARFRQRLKFKLYGFVIMDNHAHLVIEPAGNLTISRIMQSIELSYSVLYRAKYRYYGYVWQGRFRSNIINGENYLTACIDYIHDNPVRAEIVGSAKEYRWSSYNMYNGEDGCLEKVIAIDTFSWGTGLAELNVKQ